MAFGRAEAGSEALEVMANMKRHRIKLGPAARALAVGRFGTNSSEREALADLTADGTRLTYELLPPNDSGPRIRVFGRSVHAEAGQDHHRLDTFFLFKLIPRHEPPPPTARSFAARFELLDYSHAEELDPVGPVFARPPQTAGATVGASKAASKAAPGEHTPQVRAPIRLSEPLRHALARGGEFPAIFHPRATEEEPTPEQLRKAWKQLVERIRRRPSVTTREDLILAGVTAPRDLTHAGLRDLRLHLERVFISEILEQCATNVEQTITLAAEFGRSPHPTDAGRAALWSAAVSEHTASDLRDEVVLLGDSLGALSSDRERPWWDALCAEVNARHGDRGQPKDAQAIDDLSALLQRADDSDGSYVAEVARWAKERRMSLTATLRQDTSPLVSSNPTPIPTPLQNPPPPLVADEQSAWVEYREAIEAWTLRQLGFSGDQLEELRGELDSLREAIIANIAALRTPDGLRSIPTLGKALRDLLERRQMMFTDDSAARWEAGLAGSRQAFDESCRYVGSPAVVARVIQRRSLAHGEIRAAALMFAQRQYWQSLPSWWWEHLGVLDRSGSGQDDIDDAALLELFCQPAARNLTMSACARLSDIDRDLLSAVAELRPPSRGTTADEHLAAEIASLSNTLGHARNKYAASITGLLDAGTLDQMQFADASSALDDIEQRLSPTTFQSLCKQCAASDTADSLRRILRATERALGRYLQLFQTATPERRRSLTGDLTWMQLQELINQHVTDVEDPRANASALGFELHFADVGTVVEEEETRQKEIIADRPPLFFMPTGSSGIFGHVVLPIVVRTTHPRVLELTFTVRDDKDRLRAAWPSAADSDTPTPELAPSEVRIAEEDWQKDESEYSSTLALRLPIRRPSPSDSLSFTLVAKSADGAEAQHRYSWERFVTEADPEDGKPLVTMDWTTREDPNLARAVPVGPQVHLRTALKRIKAGNSLAVTAPRRFGKSSLLALLEEKLAEDQAEGTVAVRVDCNHATNAESRQFDHLKLWTLVSEELERKLPGARLGGGFDGNSPALPGADDFRAARAVAFTQGKKRIVVFFDEAQRMFEAGPAYGDRLRTLIATHLADRPNLATVVFCFVGLNSITSERLGADLYPLLNPLSHDELKEAQITKVIRKVIGKERTIFTTRAARERLARSSWNLYALRTLLKRTQDMVREDWRLWVSVEDVIRAEEQILAELRSGQNPEAINTYIRDSLNIGSSADDFRPVLSFPVAAAYAVALGENRVGRDAVDATKRTLNEWSATLFRHHLRRPSFDVVAIEKHLTSLVDLRILDRVRDARGGLRFRSEFLRSYLVGQVQGFLYDADWFREVMLQAGSPAIRLPPESECEVLGQGAQARAFRFARDGQELTARVRELKNPEERESFLENLVLLEKIRRIHDGNRDGAEGIFKLLDVGLEHGVSEPRAVEVYHFIPGVDLGTKIGRLDLPVIVKLGRALARALALVHEHDVLHRDLRPENVILQDHAFPVIIDFGLACVRSAPGGTPLDDKFTAPEVKVGEPNWTSAADVFSLAKTLEVLLSSAAQNQPNGRQLRQLLNRFMSLDPRSRMSASALGSELEKLETNLNIKDREGRLRAQLLTLVKGERELEWVVTEGCSFQIGGFELGMYANERERLGAVAFIVNKVAERSLPQLDNDTTSVAKYARQNLSRPWPIGIDAIVNLRNEFTHPKRSSKQYTRAQVLEGTRAVRDWTSATKLPALVEALLALAN